MTKNKSVVDDGSNLHKIGTYLHKDKSRKNNSKAALAAYDKADDTVKTYSFDPQLTPTLDWVVEKEHLSFEVNKLVIMNSTMIHTRSKIRYKVKNVLCLMKRKYFKLLFLSILCASCFSSCGEIKENSSDIMNTSEKVTSTSNIEERKECQTTAFKAEVTSISNEKAQNDTDNYQITVDSAHFSAVVDGSKWYTEDKTDDTVVEILGMSYKWLGQKDMEKKGSAKPSMIQFGPVLEDFNIQDLDQEKLNGQTDVNKIFLMICEQRLQLDYAEVQLSQIEEHSGIKMSHVRTYIDYKAAEIERPNLYQDEFVFYAGGAMNEIVVGYTDDEEGYAAYNNFESTIIDNITLKE